MADQRNARNTTEIAASQNKVMAAMTYPKGLSPRDMQGVRGNCRLVPALGRHGRVYCPCLSSNGLSEAGQVRC